MDMDGIYDDIFYELSMHQEPNAFEARLPSMLDRSECYEQFSQHNNDFPIDQFLPLHNANDETAFTSGYIGMSEVPTSQTLVGDLQAQLLAPDLRNHNPVLTTGNDILSTSNSNLA